MVHFCFQIFVRSTDYDRTLMSAEANLAGLYPPNNSQVFESSVHWQPIPVHTVPQSQERVSVISILLSTLHTMSSQRRDK